MEIGEMLPAKEGHGTLRTALRYAIQPAIFHWARHDRDSLPEMDPARGKVEPRTARAWHVKEQCIQQ